MSCIAIHSTLDPRLGLLSMDPLQDAPKREGRCLVDAWAAKVLQAPGLWFGVAMHRKHRRVFLEPPRSRSSRPL